MDARLTAIATHYEAMDYRKAAAETRALWAAGNEYLTRAEPWTHFKTNRDRAAIGVRTGIALAAVMARVAQPIIPNAAATILDAVGATERDWPDSPARELLTALAPGHAITPPDVLFAKIDDDQVAEWTERFGGAPAA